MYNVAVTQRGAATLATYAEQLESVQNAIASIEAGNQSTSILGRSFTKADLATLYTRERWLRKMVARESRGGLRIQRVVPL